MNLQLEGVAGMLDHGVLQGLPAALLGEALPGGSTVAPLRFESLDAMWRAEAAAPDCESLDATADLKERIAALEAQIQRSLHKTRDELELARLTARNEARQEWEMELDERLTVERELVLQACDRFRSERDKYFAAAEGEVVKLSLAIARRVLHREAAIDPMMLAGVVRVTLEKMQEKSAVVVRVPVAEEPLWRGSLEVQADGVELVGDERMTAGECVITTSLGCVELGVSAQLEEIEKGFLDLLQRRPV